MKMLAIRYTSVLAGLLLQSLLFIMPNTTLVDLGWLDAVYVVGISLGGLLLIYGMFQSGLPKEGEARRLEGVGPTLLGTLGAMSLVVSHDGGLQRILLIGLLVSAIALPGVVSRMRTSKSSA